MLACWRSLSWLSLVCITQKQGSIISETSISYKMWKFYWKRLNIYLPKSRPLCKPPPPSLPTRPHRQSGPQDPPRRREMRGTTMKRRHSAISSSGSAEASCIRGREAARADPRSSLSLNLAGHLTTAVPGEHHTDKWQNVVFLWVKSSHTVVFTE